MSQTLRRVALPIAAATGISLTAVLIFAGHAAAQGATADGATALPEVNVIQDEAPPAAAAAAKPAKKPSAAASAQTAKSQNKKPVAKPAVAQAPPVDDYASADVAPNGAELAAPSGSPAARSQSLTAPTVAEAQAELETTPGGVKLVPAASYQKATPSLTIKDALDYVPGVFVQPKWGDDTRLSIRGSGLSRSFHGRGVALLMDGVLPISTSDGASDFQEIDPTAYRYIEVYKGANALKYGANALGGAINFVMPTGYDSNAFGTRLDVGSFGLYKLAVSSGGVSGPADYFFTGTWQQQDGFRDHSEGESVRGALNIGYKLSPDAETRFYVNSNYVRQKIPGAVTRAEALTNPSAAFVRPGTPATFLGVGNDNVDRDYERNIDSIRVANKTALRLAPGTLVEFGGYYFNRHLDHPILLVVDNRNNEGGGFTRLTDDREIAGHRNRLIAGVTVQHGDIRARTFQNILGERAAALSDANQISTTTTAYLENAFYLTPQFALVGGTQFTNVDRQLNDNFPLLNGDESRSASFDFWSPKVGFLFDVAANMQVFGNVSKSSEVATFNEITFVSGNTLALKPQEAVTYEIGARGAGRGYTYDLSLYRANLENEFQCLAVGASGSCTQVNLDKTIHQGIELGFGVEVASGLFVPGARADAVWLNTSYTLNDFRFDGDATFGDNELPGAPRHFVRAELLYKHPSGVYAGPNVEWVPEAYFADSANTLQTKAYALLGAKLGFDDGGPISAYLEARNLTDEKYIASSNIANIADANSTLFEPGNGRAVYGGIQVKW